MYKFNPRKGKFLIGFVLLVVGGLILYANWPGLAAHLARVAYLTKGEVQTTQDLRGTLIADQKVLVAPATGRITWLAAQGKRVPVGATVATVLTAGGRTIALHTPAAGLLSYTTDGLETVLRPANLPDITMPGAGRSVTHGDGSLVDAGQAVGRVTDNLEPVYIYVAGHPLGLPDGNKPWVLTWRGRDLAATVLLRPQEGFFLRLDRYPDQLLDNREVSFAVITQTLSGYLVPETALADRNGRTGLYIVEHGQAQWDQVAVTGHLKGMAALAGPLPDKADLYVATPQWVRDGVPVR